MMSCIKAFLTILAVQALVGAASNATSSSSSSSTSSDDGLKFTKSSKDPKSCKADNDFEYPECGTGDDTICCDTRAACIEAENKEGTTWKKKYYCSLNRGMTGTKLVKIIMIPLILFLFAITFVVLMVLKLDIKGNHVTKLGVAVIAVAWPLFLSEKWIYGAYSCIVALFVSFVSQSTQLTAPFQAPFPWWVYRLAWAMCAFQVIMLLGPTEAFHVPLYKQSLAATPTDLVNTVMKITETSCQAHYENFFTLTSIELNAKEVDPGAKYSGLCANGWLNFVQIILLVQAFLWFATLLVASPVLLADPIQNQSTTKVVPAVAPTIAVAAEKPASASLADTAASSSPAPPPPVAAEEAKKEEP